MSFYQPDAAELDYREVITALLVVTWVVFYTTGWSNENKSIALKWGTCGFENIQKDRPQFKAERKPDGTNCRSIVDNKKIQYYPESKRQASQFFSTMIVVICVAIVACTNIATFFLIKREQMRHGVDATSLDPNDVMAVFSQYLIFGLYTPIFSYFYGHITNIYIL